MGSTNNIVKENSMARKAYKSIRQRKEERNAVIAGAFLFVVSVPVCSAVLIGLMQMFAVH
jgi:hypothetical protein